MCSVGSQAVILQHELTHGKSNSSRCTMYDVRCTTTTLRRHSHSLSHSHQLTTSQIVPHTAQHEQQTGDDQASSAQHSTHLTHFSISLVCCCTTCAPLACCTLTVTCAELCCAHLAAFTASLCCCCCCSSSLVTSVLCSSFVSRCTIVSHSRDKHCKPLHSSHIPGPRVFLPLPRPASGLRLSAVSLHDQQ